MSVNKIKITKPGDHFRYKKLSLKIMCVAREISPRVESNYKICVFILMTTKPKYSVK